jgi:hypothetical protein
LRGFEWRYLICWLNPEVMLSKSRFVSFKKFGPIGFIKFLGKRGEFAKFSFCFDTETRLLDRLIEQHMVAKKTFVKVLKALIRRVTHD